MRAVGRIQGIVLIGCLIIAVAIGLALLVYPLQYIYRVIAWQDPDVFDWQKLPSHPLHAAASPAPFPVDMDPRVATLFAELAATDEWDTFLADHDTQAFIVIHDGTIRYEQYFNEATRDSIVTSFSVAKAYATTLIGFAIDDGYIENVDDPITRYLPELAQRDPQFAMITIRHLLRMASGLAYQESRLLRLNSDDMLVSYHPDQRKIALEHPQIAAPPGTYFRYNRYLPQLLGLILERTTDMTPTAYLQARLWEPLGMEYDGSWSTDSLQSNFEMMETGVNARAVDFAKFGQLFLDNGQWRGEQVIAADWVAAATQPWHPDDPATYYPPLFAALPGDAYYAYMWWGFARPDGTYDFAAVGNKGQFIYIAPAKRLVIVRNGIEYGIPFEQWLHLFYTFADRY